MVIGLSHGGTTIYQGGNLADSVMIGTMDGVVVLSKSAEGAWKTTGHGLQGLHIHAIIFAEGLVFAGAYRSGVFASVDGGATWESRDNGVNVRSVFSLASAVVDGRTRLFVGTEPAHLYYSDDLGLSWTELPELRMVGSVQNWRFAADPFEAHLKHINFHPDDTSHIYASIEVGGLLESTDAGATWHDLDVPVPDVHRTLFDPRDANRMWNTGGGLIYSGDAGQTWDTWMPKDNNVGGYPDQLVLVPSNPDVMYLGSSETGPRSWVREGYSTAGGRIAKSTDGGRSWTVLRGGLPDGLHGNIEAMCLDESPIGVSLFAGTTDGEVWCSEDGGDTWSKIAQLAGISKSIHAEMLTTTRTTDLKFTDGEVAAKTV